MAQSQIIIDRLFGGFTIGATAYDMFAGLTVFALTGANPVNIELDFLNTGTLGIQTDNDVSFTSSSGVLLSAAEIPSIPEPATMAMMLIGFGLLIVVMRRRETEEANICA